MPCHIVIRVLNIIFLFITSGLLPRVSSALGAVHICLALCLCVNKGSVLRCLNFPLALCGTESYHYSRKGKVRPRTGYEGPDGE